MEYKTVILEKMDGFGMVTLNRPHDMNAISMTMTKELEDCFCVLDKDDSMRAVVLTGGDFLFSAGMDIKEMAELTDDEIDLYFETMSQYLSKIYTFK
ncbi:MAG: enoyl-CoA hydratase/isomerase family protein, partial [Deltaproteobacteria bacterium]